MEFLQPFLDTVKDHYFDFEGRTGRRTFWMYILVYFIISFIIGILKMPSLSYLLSLALLLPTLGIGARRLHDIGKSGWLQLLGLIPLIGFIIMIYFWAQPGQPEENEYGPVPEEE